MDQTQPQRRPQKSEVREYRPVRNRRKGFRLPIGFVVVLAVVAVALQWTGTVDLGIPLGAPPASGSHAARSSNPVSVSDAQADLRDVISSAASVVRSAQFGPRGPAGEAGPDYEHAGEAAPPQAGDAAAPGSSGAPADPSSTAGSATGSGPRVTIPDGAAARGAAPLAIAPGSQPVALPPSGDGYRSEVERAWFSGGQDLTHRALQARTRALQLGAANYESASRALLAPAAEGIALERAMLAARLSPDLPMARMELAGAYLHDGQYLNALREVGAGVAAIPRNLEASLWLAASLLAMFAAVLTLGSMVFIAWVGLSVFRHAAHDVGDLVSRDMPEFARAALLGSLLLVPLLLGEAAMGLVLALFLLGFTYCEAGYRRALALAAMLLVLGIYPVTRLSGMALTALDSDPVAAAADSVVRSMASSADIDILRTASAREDWLAEAALALHERRSGDAELALARYEQLLDRTPTDPVVLTVLSNMAFERGDNARSIQLGERAAALVRSATLLFNLSQVYARSFQMDEFEGAMAQAQLVDPEVVAELSKTKAPDFVADLAFPTAPIRDRMLQGAGGDRFVDPVSRAIMPGHIGRDWVTTAGAFALTAVLGVGIGGGLGRASSCRRCGRRICGRCDGTVWNSQICDGCHHLFHRPETTDPAMRMARLSELRARESRVSRLATLASVLVPGAAGLLARRPDLGFLGLFLFFWAVLLILWRKGVVVDPLAIGAVGPLLFTTAAALSILGYGLVVGLGLMIRRSL